MKANARSVAVQGSAGADHTAAPGGPLHRGLPAPGSPANPGRPPAVALATRVNDDRGTPAHAQGRPSPALPTGMSRSHDHLSRDPQRGPAPVITAQNAHSGVPSAVDQATGTAVQIGGSASASSSLPVATAAGTAGAPVRLADPIMRLATAAGRCSTRQKQMFGRHPKPGDWRDCCARRASDEPASLLSASASRRFGGAFKILAGKPRGGWVHRPQA